MSRKGWSEAAKEYVDDKTDYLIEEEGMSPKQAYAVAIDYARREGYKVPIRRIRGKNRPMRRR